MVVPPPPPTPPPTPPTPTPVPTDSSANDNAVVNQLANLTPAIAAETVRRVQANPTGFLPPREEETLTTLTDSVSQILAQRAIDDQRRLTESVKPIEDLNALLKEQTEVLASLLNRGNNQRDDAQRRAGNQLGS